LDGAELTDSSIPERSARWKRGCSTAVVVLLIFVLAGFVVFRRIGRWLVVQDSLEPSDAIVILSGGMPYRAIEAAKIFRQGMAPQVWITRPANPAHLLSPMGIPFEGEEDYSRAVLIHEGVPENAIHILPAEIVNTEDEEREIIAEMQTGHVNRVIIVTSPSHTRRVRALWRVLAPAGLALIVRPAYEDDFDADHWWRTTRDSLSVARETLGLLNAWAGLPIRPATH
jgi:uncharacterized SAM-binding protein YcdF (DUF218 family)